MINLSAKLESFIQTMGEGDEFARHGFELLAKRSDPERFFDAIIEAGFLDPSNNQGPVESTEPGFFQVPFWPALNYLEAVAKRAGELDNAGMAEKVLSIIRSVSNYRDADGAPRDNYHTYWKFGEILSVLPMRTITTDDIKLTNGWLVSKFDHGMVGRALGLSFLPRLLDSDNPPDVEKACLLMQQCMTFRWLPEDDKSGREIVTAIENYWLREIVNKNAKRLGAKAGLRAVTIFANGLRAIFSNERRSYGSSLWRPAIENNKQNMDFRGPENRFVEGTRDSLEGWFETDRANATAFIQSALQDNAEIIRRIAINAITEHFEVLREIFEAAIAPTLFTAGHRHELYRLIRERFSTLSEEGKAAVIEALKALPKPKGDEPELRLKHTQREWLTAITDYEPAAEWMKELSSDPALGSPSDHPDFLSYHEIRSGPGPTPFGADSLVAFAEDGSLVDRLNEFKENDSWKGPTMGGLVDALEGAVASSPKTFLPLLSSFHATKLPFQHALLSGFKRVYDAPKQSKPDFDWAIAWPKLFTFFSEYLDDEKLWAQPEKEKSLNLLPNRDWMLSLISSFLESGTRNDETAYSPDLLPQGWELITNLLARIAPDEKVSLRDPMTHALNTNKGRLLEALFNHALRTCRVTTQKGGTVAEAWAIVKSTFDAEIAKCRDANFEFSTLAAAYIANLDYMSREWLTANVKAIFPLEYPNNFKAALGGLVYGNTSDVIYRLLASNGVFEEAFKQKLEDTHGDERIVEWISLAYLWGDENLSSPLFARVFESAGRLDAAADFFWRVRGDKLTDDQIERILTFWEKVIEWSKTQSPLPQKLLSRLSRLSEYLESLDSRAKELLLAVVPYIHTDYSTDNMVEELARLVDTNPAITMEILECLIDANAPTYDLDDKLKKLIQKLAKMGFREQAIRCVEKLRKSLPGTLDLYKELFAGPAAG